MKIAIVFASSRGTTEKAATMLAEKLDGDIALLDVKKDGTINLSKYDAVIVGSSIHIGSIQSKVKKFIASNQQELLSKKLGLYLCCMNEGEQAQKQFETGFPEELRSHASASGIFGGEFDFSKMNFFEKLIIKMVGGSANQSTFRNDKVESFSNTFNN